MLPVKQPSKSIIGEIFSEYELKVIAKVCSIDSLSIAFDYKQIVGIQSCYEGQMINVFYENQGMWMMTMKQFVKLKDLAKAKLALEDVLENHSNNIIHIN